MTATNDKKTEKANKRPSGRSGNSPVERIGSRQIKDKTRLILCVCAGGRCEFDGCNKYVFRHHLTHAEENFSQMAHIVAFKPEGPRGKVKPRPTEINDISNLMLLCPECHHLIDTRPNEYPREVLEKYKKDHEARIFRLTGIKTDNKTTVVQLKSRIGSQTVAIPAPEIYRAISPRYAEDPQGIIIDLTNIDGQDNGFYQTAMRTIKRKVEMLYEPGMEVEKTRHISLFALAPIPLLVFLGSQLSNKVAVEPYQRHRDTEDWVWKTDGQLAEYRFLKRQSGTDPSSVALLLSLSGTIQTSELPAEIDKCFSVYEITLAKGTPRPGFLRMREDLASCKKVYEEALSSIRRDHAGLSRLHFFPAVPAPIAMLCGRELLPKVDPVLVVYDNDKNTSGFQPILKVNEK
jgi:hypothetical protein